MGCDIHGSIERMVDGKWVHVTRIYRDPHAIKQRNYLIFAALAGVRGDGPRPTGLPVDATDSSKLHAAEWGNDGHSHSSLTIRDALQRIAGIPASILCPTDFAAKYPEWHYFGMESELSELDQYRFVFWFDN